MINMIKFFAHLPRRKQIQLRSVNDLVDHNFITNRDFDNRIFKPDDCDSAYVNVV